MPRGQLVADSVKFKLLPQDGSRFMRRSVRKDKVDLSNSRPKSRVKPERPVSLIYLDLICMCAKRPQRRFAAPPLKTSGPRLRKVTSFGRDRIRHSIAIQPFDAS